MAGTSVQGVKYIVKWISSPTACAKCRALNGKVWEIFDLNETSNIFFLFSHKNCQCQLDLDMEIDPEELQIIR